MKVLLLNAILINYVFCKNAESINFEWIEILIKASLDRKKSFVIKFALTKFEEMK